MTDDVELLRRYATERSEEAFTTLVQRHLPLVYHAALRRTNGDAHLAEDVAQAVFANLAREAVSLQRHEVLAGWLYVATRHAAANAMRTEQRRKTREQEAFTMSESSAPVLSGAEWEQLRPELDAVMDELGEADRNAVLLRFFENRPYAEIGASFRISEDAARMRVERALEKLRTLLGRRGITSTAAALGGLLAAQSAVAAPAGLAAAVAGSALVCGTATGTAGLIAFMTTNKIAWGIAGVIALAAGGSAIHQFQDASESSAALALLRAEQTKLQWRLKDEEEQARLNGESARAAQERVAELEKSLAAAKENGGGSHNQARSLAKTAPAGSVPDNQILFAHPEYVQLQMKMAEIDLKFKYGLLYRKLGWSGDKIRAFEQLKLQEQQDLFDVMAAASATGLSMGDPAIRAGLNDAVAQQRGESLRSLIGEKDFPAYQEYGDGRMGAARRSVDLMGSNLYHTDVPLTYEQGSQLTQLISKNIPKPAIVDGISNIGRPDWEVVYAKAEEFLSPKQIEVLRIVTERDLLGLESYLLQRKLLEQAKVAGH